MVKKKKTTEPTMKLIGVNCIPISCRTLQVYRILAHHLAGRYLVVVVKEPLVGQRDRKCGYFHEVKFDFSCRVSKAKENDKNFRPRKKKGKAKRETAENFDGKTPGKQDTLRPSFKATGFGGF